MSDHLDKLRQQALAALYSRRQNAIGVMLVENGALDCMVFNSERVQVIRNPQGDETYTFDGVPRLFVSGKIDVTQVNEGDGVKFKVTQEIRKL